MMVFVELKTDYMAKRKDKENLVVELQNNDTNQTVKKSGNLTIATALTQVIEQAKDSHLSEEFWKTCEAPLAYLHEQFGLSAMQIVFVAALIERGDSSDMSDIASYFGITRFEVMTHTNELDDLVLDGWATINKCIMGFDVYNLVPEFETALIYNLPFKPDTKQVEQQPEDNDSDNGNKDASGNDSDDANDSNGSDDGDKSEENDDYVKNACRFTTLNSYTGIQEKTLFYNAQEEKLIQRLTDMLNAENLTAIRQRLEQHGMRKGFACLFYGGPGTGKTETVLQIARQTGRDVLQVDLSKLRSKWVGDTLKNVKAVFTHYRTLCKNSEVMPILFFNEADGIFNQRSERLQQYCDKEENALQNIILEEIENLDGILIATTNLTSNLDKAFERRFLYKIEFQKPGTEVRAKIWHSMMEDMSVDDALRLATLFDFSGGQIENIARKHIVDSILTGRRISFEEIEDSCRLEVLPDPRNRKKKRIPIVGFASY